MAAIKTILVATDLKKRSAAAPERAAALARALGAKVVLAHAIPERNGTVARFRLRRNPSDRSKIEAAFAQIRQQYSDVAIDQVIASGSVEDIISRTAHDISADLVVLGLHKVRAVLDTLRLTTMERITLAVTCPVLIAHTAGALPYRRVLGAITFAPASAQALATAGRLAPDAEFNAIHALQLSLKDKLPNFDAEESAAMTQTMLLREAFMRMDGLPTKLNMPEIVPGGVHEVLQFRINELQPDLIVIGSDSGKKADSLGNYARDLMRAPPADLLIAKPC
ncbi:universal stress protein [Roseinatronobacter sp. S2]|uniref:universal stress protein n=1 Tax=Roseinatronobacter sp. S2 TaxID=3035471 RepID=UPI00240F5A85|nr:universal stress protein [Roseinatronobacter sp. S2]WFE73293.1 universal stress protein [Roseinatronobacter sp. S2]